ncbi:M28 family peptidase [Tautonia plasticadhaerens]|uniref:Peptidase family M28 n=1 Tax=Tautonia plasticadhaerens TaxID=2527974 RepID=A0A518H005_9BACT|nr:M28 family peptidase [Tautonia plasticadhaerens]QDV34168.1 Peptidase family M28 [Tautonia plasticadhaerens]
MSLPGWADRFDGDRAIRDIVRLCALGPRPSGSPAAGQQRRVVAEHFRSSGGAVSIQGFRGEHPLTGEPVPMANVVASWRPGASDRLLVAAHGDTRPVADRERDPARRLLPFLGANDGGSGVAALMELARHVSDLPGALGVDLAVFDAEELVFDEVGDYCLGSREFARRHRRAFDSGGPSYEAAVVLDMVAGRSMQLNREGFGLEYAAWLTEELWEVARDRGASRFSEDCGHYVEDDHLPLLAIGVPSVALVDIEFPEWHTVGDTPEACDPRAIEEVGRVVMGWLGRVAGEGPGR